MQLSRTIFSLLIISLPIWAQPAGEAVWQIGKFDRSPLEFSGGERGPAQFEVGRSDWKTDWPSHQAINSPYKIAFPLSSAAGTYTLKIAVLIEQPRVPALQVSINGHQGAFFFRPRLRTAGLA